jgi:hypothetical protein
MSVSVNTEQVLLKITGLFDSIQRHLVQIMVKFPLTNQKEFLCTIETIQNERL